MISFGLWIAGMLGRQVTQQQAKRLGMAVGLPLIIVGLVLLAWLGKTLYDRNVVEAFKDRQHASAAKGQLKADRAANAEAVKRAEIAEAENARLENAMAEAERREPEKAAKTVGPVQQSYFDNLPKRR